VLALAAGSFLASPAAAWTLDILHFNDFHSRIESINAFDSTCSAEDEAAGKCFGGAARLVTEVAALRDELKAKGGNVLVLMAGDAFQGSLFFTAYSGAAEAEMLNRIGLDAMVYGNHEFDLGPAPLAKFAVAAEFPVISGSADVSGDKDLAPVARDHLILELGGEKVAILGATTPDTPEISSPGPTVSFRDPVAYLTETVAAVTAEGANKVILLSHLGSPLDQKVAAEVPGIDAIVGGHSHDLYSNTDSEAPYRYPVIVTGPGGVKVPIVQAGAYSKYLGHETLVFDDAGELASATGDSMLLDASVTPDAATLARIKELAGPIEALKSRKVAEITGDIDATREVCRAGECPMGDLVTDAMLARVEGQGVTMAITNGGGLRASIKGGTVTMGDVIAVLPFQNTLSTFNIRGADIVAALENGVSQVEEGAGRFPQVAGLRFTWDSAVAPGQGRVKTVEVRDGDDWAPLEAEKIYTVASNNFLRAGGDGYVAFRDGATNAYDYGPGLEDVLADFLAANPDYAPETGRISRAQ
jgi:5'-nucleotidase